MTGPGEETGGGKATPEFYAYWGKARPESEGAGFHLLVYHALDVAAVGRRLLEGDGRLLGRIARLSGFTAESLWTTLPFQLGLHDLGKFAEPFQDQQPDLVAQLQGARPSRACEHRHDTLGYVLWSRWARKPEAGEDALLERLHSITSRVGALGRTDLGYLMAPWMAAVLGHHGRPPALPGPPRAAFVPGSRSSRDAAAFALELRELLGPVGLVAESEDLDLLLERVMRASWWVAGFTILCDWVGSDARFFGYESGPMPLADYWKVALAAAGAAVERSGLTGARPRPFLGIQSLFPHVVEPSPLQAGAARVPLSAGPQLFVLEDLTGSGKTEAALALAHRLMEAGQGEGIYFALPTMATANAMAARVEPLLDRLFDGQASFLLTHSGPRLTERDHLAVAGPGPERSYGPNEQPEGGAAASAWLADGRKKALLAELGVGTIDQALLAALQSRHAALRLFGLQRRVLVVDEVHACDPYMLKVLGKLLEMHAALGGSAILLSATLPSAQRRELGASFERGLGRRGSGLTGSDAYPLLTRCGTGDRARGDRPAEIRRVMVER